MLYVTFRKAGYVVGSSVVAASCKTVARIAFAPEFG